MLGRLVKRKFRSRSGAEALARAARLSLENSQRQSAREPGLEIEQTDPYRRNRDSHHLLNHRAELLYPGLPLLASEIALGSNGIFGNDAFQSFESRRTAHQQHLVGEAVVVNRQRPVAILRDRLHLGSIWWSRQHKIALIPVEPDGYDPGSAVGPDIGQARRNG